MLHDTLIAVIRTAVPSAVGVLIAWLLQRGVVIPDDVAMQLSGALVAVCITLYYALVTLLERKVHPAFGWLLGVPTAPTYAPTATDYGQDVAA